MRYRLFIAAELPAPVKDALAAAQEQLRAARPPVAWSAPDGMHLTLRFLGDTDAELVEPIGDALEAALAGVPAPLLELGEPGAFPSLARPSVLWVGVRGDTAGLARAQALVSGALDALGLPPQDKPFSPHLTLGRVRPGAGRAAQARLGPLLRALPPPAAAAWHADEIVLFRSELGAAGARYTALRAARLPIAG